MPLLISQSILGDINKEIEKCNESFIVISAFCKLSLIKYFDGRLASTVSEKKLIVRMKPEDIVKGATDIELYDYCKEHGWILYFKLDLHAKTYVFDHVRCIVGSANATASGLSVGGVGNYEMATASNLDKDDCAAISDLVKYSVEMTDEIYQIMKDSLASRDSNINLDSLKWPDEITKLSKVDFSILFTEDFPAEASPFNDEGSEFYYWDDVSKLTKKEVMDLFTESKCYLWLKSELQKKDNHELYFGEATALLHNVLLNDPKPYRREVKELLANLLSWITELECKEIIVDRPNHSQRIKLVE